jgi:hypothetical protein
VPGMPNMIHVVMVDRKWAVMRPGDAAPLSLHERRDDAVTRARALAGADSAEVVVFDVGGRPLAAPEGAKAES